MVDDSARVLAPLSGVTGALSVPGDKSISHRALLFAAVSEGTSEIIGLSSGDDVQSTRKIVETLGIHVEEDERRVRVHGRGWRGIDREPEAEALTLDCGNSGTTARLLLGVLAGRRGVFRLIGDTSLSSRPMGRVVRPLRAMGAQIEGGDGLPLVVHGRSLAGGSWRPEVPSAQVKSCLLLASLQASGKSAVHEERPTRDHSERMLIAAGAPIEEIDEGQGWNVVGGAKPLRSMRWRVPGDPSSAAYAVALALCLPESRVRVQDVSVNPTRLGFFSLLRRMGARVEWTVEQSVSEPVGTIEASSSHLKGLSIGRDEVTGAIDEIPLLAVVATQAQGSTVIRGAEELRKKESDRIRTTVELLRRMGAEVEEFDDGLSLTGPQVLAGGSMDARHDHRVAMCTKVAASLARAPSTLTGHHWASVSYPAFYDDIDRLGDVS